MSRRWRQGRAIALALSAMSALPAYADTNDAPSATATRGITGSVTVRVAGDRLRARPDLGLDATMLVRVVDVRSTGDGANEHRFEFIGTIAGVFDLREVLERADGSPATDVEPIMVEIFSHLPENAATDVFSLSTGSGRFRGGYRRALITLGVLWMAVPIVVYVRRVIVRRAEPVPPAPVSGPTLADQLEPLVRASGQRELSVAEQGRLELLLYSYWQARLDLGAVERPSAVAQLRRHPEAGRLLRAVEGWLHSPAEAPPGRQEIASLLDPYRQAQAIDAGGLA